MKSLFKIAFLLLLSPIVKGQDGFEKVYLFGDSLARISNVYETDSCIYYVASVGKDPGRLYHRLGKLDHNGNELNAYNYTIDSLYQYSGYALSEMQLNNNGNFLFAYTNQHLTGVNYLSFRLLEQQPDGTIVLDTLYNDLWTTDSLLLFDDSKLFICSDNTYLYATTYWDFNTDSNGQWFDGRAGTIVIKLAQDGQIIWKKEYHDPSPGFYPPAYYFRDLELHADNSFTLYFNHNAITLDFDADDIAVNYFLNCDLNGNEISRDTFQDTQYCYGTPGYQELEDGSCVFGYLDSYTFGQQPDQDETNVRPVIARLDSEHQLIWKTPLTINYYPNVDELEFINDFEVKYEYVYVAVLYDVLLDPITAYAFLRFHKVNTLNGSIEWVRDYGYFPIDSIQDPGYSIKDIDTTQDGGFLLAGVCYKWDDFQGNKPYQYGYLLKTNCLGFLGSPQAAASVVSSSTDTVVFVNHSVQAGSYTWFFGDGQSTTTSEYVDTVVHTYAQTGTYTITLIAHGCNNENDTLTFQHTIADTIPSYHGDGTLLTVFPNPVISGNNLSVYIGDIDVPADLVLTDETGKVVFKQTITVANTTYMLPMYQLAAATYFVKLVQEHNMLESEQVVVVH